MASLDKLAIRGIRSFDDKQVSIIEFFSPVTVIVGHNGSGKTTIIECLKYATTGDQPPNTRGGAFVHDPKIANEKEVKAQVKLRFYAANGTRMLAVRNLSVTAKKAGGLTMKTLESILSIEDDRVDKGKKRSTISTKCAEMDIEIPNLLGVSKSVLENVIFCHQEDSYWPLAEPAALKKKFDDIFEATRYTKALDNIKALRKDRVSELKAEKERLESLAKEKAHADKLRARIVELASTIESKGAIYDETKQQYEAVAMANAKYHEYASRFREIYNNIENLEVKKKALQEDYDETRTNVPDIAGTDEELQQRVDRFDETINTHKKSRRTEDAQRQDIEEDLKKVRSEYEGFIRQKAGFEAEAQQQQERITAREQLIRGISEEFGMKGFAHGALDAPKITEFVSRLEDLQRKHNSELEMLQAEKKSKQEEYNAKSRELTAAVEKRRADRSSLRQQIVERNKAITDADRELEDCQELPAQLKSITSDIEDKTHRLQKLETELKSAKYEEKLAQIAEKKSVAESKRDTLNAEFMMLNREAESRASLNLKRKDVQSKAGEIGHAIELANAKFKKLSGKTVTAQTIEEEIERVVKIKDDELANAESQASTANAALQQAEAMLTEKTTALRSKEKDLKTSERRLKGEYETKTLEESIREAVANVKDFRETLERSAGANKVYERLLEDGKHQKKCTACNRHLNDDELRVFEKYLKAEIKKSSPAQTKKDEDDLKEWEGEADRLQKLRPLEASRNALKHKDVPELEAQVAEQEKLVSSSTIAAEEASDKLDDLKKEQREIQSIKEYARTVGRLQKEVERLQKEVMSIEKELASSGSTKSTEDIQNEIEVLANEIRALEKEGISLARDRDRQNATQRTVESEIHRLEIELTKIASRIKDKENLEKQIVQWKNEIEGKTTQVKTAEQHLAEAQGPIDALDAEMKSQQRELDVRITEASKLAQKLNRNSDKFGDTQKQVEKYVQARREQRHKECDDQLEERRSDIKEIERKLQEAWDRISKIEKEINESGSALSNLRENVRLRKVLGQINKAQTEIDSYDLDEAAKARRTFQEKWPEAKKKEESLQTKYSHIGGEISSHKSQLDLWEQDAKDFKDINKHYTDQLINVKMSDMANNDLEKYAKALDNAIMKYHGLKMEEVNDTMRHLWNKTYQGTDIDGIKIRSDAEGGASKRSYNYRVVMTKDQVEMDMRGRCSAGQKMLASIIIRLALSDSFGQNCGILALDEPTNALDTENIEALASSLVDIINERKNHSNFQLIIITHDENFLRKLGQSDVMEHYWRVSRDSRQKSITERQRVR